MPIYEDVRKLKGNHFERNTIELICGGFPCQPFSQAGLRRGKEDDRHLWPEYFRLIQEIRPRWVFGENVAGIITMGLDEVLSDLESENYSCQTLVIPACALNALHRRDRVWIVAHSESIRIQRGGSIRKQKSETHGRSGLSMRDSSEGIGDFWAIEPKLDRVAHGIPNRAHRIKQLGNAVVPQVVEIIGRAIMEADIG